MSQGLPGNYYAIVSPCDNNSALRETMDAVIFHPLSILLKGAKSIAGEGVKKLVIDIDILYYYVYKTWRKSEF